ncbi:hypothetical protein LSAT2_011879 [Lamellibrachia satsuma]|nr:hypothetical protein LSAT2_011879 [Lamellibrachia satsuma]
MDISTEQMGSVQLVTGQLGTEQLGTVQLGTARRPEVRHCNYLVGQPNRGTHCEPGINSRYNFGRPSETVEHDIWF